MGTEKLTAFVFPWEEFADYFVTFPPILSEKNGVDYEWERETMEQVMCKRQRKGWLFALLGVSTVILCLYGYYWMKVNVPSEIKLLLG